ncbi:carboxymuconolactone decarboxylase family protein [Tenacibaculum jejuense]|uniref:Alkylhydroperoxidase AhpD family core domain protein n=1 Tax=Tenacibaculum jejuense TaxID=584609 RepID=A0A238U793_9FLAO|nr:peroxidase-related enzyme [Tenacibaculum jejuense]SNR15079.1 Alkylhydroperoxidase AhpD family core domain protein [Tenacibaculum jejuense]
MSWINIIPFEKAEGKLKKLYERVTGPNNNVDNIMMVHSLRSNTMEGHMAIYKKVLHHSDNTLPKWYLETIGVYVSILNHCEYCIDHHFEGLKRLLNDNNKASKIKEELKVNSFNELSIAYAEGLKYAEKLTVNPSELKEEDINKLKENGISDAEILEINQVVSYFNYANRTVLGLGVTTKGDILGLSPNSSQEDNWKHQ